MNRRNTAGNPLISIRIMESRLLDSAAVPAWDDALMRMLARSSAPSVGPSHLAIGVEDASGRGFFELLLQNTREGFFADPLYGGNRDMVGWKMIGFPGARYDYRDWVEHHNEKYPRPPVAITGRPDWTPRQG